jgi:hypothetical protein
MVAFTVRAIAKALQQSVAFALYGRQDDRIVESHGVALAPSRKPVDAREDNGLNQARPAFPPPPVALYEET